MTTSWKKHAAFVGPRVISLLTIGVVTGLALGLVEVAFAYALQAFLVALGLLNGAASANPAWLPHGSLAVVLAFVAGVGVVRGLLQGVYYLAQNATMEEVQYLQRTRILRWALKGESASSSHVTALFNARALGAGSMVFSIQGLAVQATMALLLGGALLWLSPTMTVLAGLVLVALALPLIRWDKSIKQVAAATIQEWDKTNSRMLMSIRNLLLLQICGMQDQEEAIAQQSLGAYLKHLYRMFVLTSLKLSVPQVAGPLLVCVIALAARRYHLMGSTALVAYFYLLLRLVQTASTANQSITGLVFGLPHYEELFAWWLAAEQGASASAAPASASVSLPAGERIGWRLTRVAYRYPQGTSAVFSALDLTIDPGSTVVITGPSGAGKSTLLGLLLGTLRPRDGRVDVLTGDDRPVPLDECRTALLPRVGYVGPESFLLEGTIRQNIAYGLQDSVSQEAIDRALALAECQFVSSLPRGLEHPLTEQGQGLSAGQKQRLALARALLRKPTVLILDEATSNLDAETEERLVDTLDRLKGSMTIVAVTHRQALLRIADRHVDLGSFAQAPASSRAA